MRLRPFAIAAALFAFAAPARAGSARLKAESNEVYVGVPFRVVIEVTAEKDRPAPPEFPPIDGATVEFAGTSEFSSSSISITVGGRTIQQKSTFQFTYNVTPTREGQLHLPAVEVQVDGERLRTAPAVFNVSKAETGDLMLLELTAPRDSIYLGESLDVTLRVLLQPYAQGRVRLNGYQMWQEFVDVRRSNWGVFQEIVFGRDGQIKVTEETRIGLDGQPHRYAVYEMTAKIVPDRAGPLDVGDVRVAAEYPLKIVSRGLQLSVAQKKPIVATLPPSKVQVKPLPTEGRPPYFSGAVGPHSIAAAAAPTEARVGDPITLHLTVTGAPGAQLDAVQAPALSQVTDFAERFQVDDEQLPGKISGNRKQFAASIRARSTDVTEIPPIPFAWFDPVEERYVTATTAAIPVKILPAERMTAAQIVEGARGDYSNSRGNLTPVERGLAANYSDLDALLARQSFGPGAGSLAALAAPPVIYAATALLSWKRRRERQDVARTRRAAAKRVFQQRLRHAESIRSVHEAMGALLGYVADRLNLPPGGLTRDEAVARLRETRLDDASIAFVDRVLADGELAEFAGAGVPMERIARNIREAVERMEKARIA